MNRTTFIKSLGLGASGLMLPANRLINTQPVKIYDNYIRGLMHYDFKNVREDIKEGDEVQLAHEPANMYDSFAIQVNRGEERLGYLAVYENIVLANMTDAGAGLRAYVCKKDLKWSAQQWLTIEVFTKLVVPTQKLVDSVLAANRADDAPDISVGRG